MGAVQVVPWQAGSIPGQQEGRVGERERLIMDVAAALAEVDASHEVYHQRPYVEWAQAAVEVVERRTRLSIAELADHYAANQRRAQDWADRRGWLNSSAAARISGDTMASFANIIRPVPPQRP